MRQIIKLILITTLFSCESESRNTRIREIAKNEQSTKKTTYKKNKTQEFIEIEYHSNGQIKSIEEQGIENSCGIFVGSHFYFDSLGNHEKQIVYESEPTNIHGNCLDIIHIKHLYVFYKNGELRSESHYKNTYEGEPLKIGEWIEYDSNGIELNSTNF